MVFVIMFSLVVAQVLGTGLSLCPRYHCLQSVNSTCISTEGNTVYVSQCPAGFYCPPTLSSENVDCEVEELRVERVLPGERCRSNENCMSGLCESGKCVGKEAGEDCEDHADCNAPLYCTRKKKCDLQIYESSWLSCRNDYDCRNYLTCQFGACVPYLSRSEGEQVHNCVSNSSLACESTLCTSNYCLRAITNDKPIPVYCSSAADCVSSWYSSENQPFLLHTECNCALDAEGRGVCELFPGDPPYQDFLGALQHIVQRKHNWACHTLRRFSLECLDSSEYHGKYADLIQKFLFAEHYAELVYSQPCVQQVYFPAYQSAQALLIIWLVLA